MHNNALLIHENVRWALQLTGTFSGTANKFLYLSLLCNYSHSIHLPVSDIETERGSLDVDPRNLSDKPLVGLLNLDGADLFEGRRLV